MATGYSKTYAKVDTDIISASDFVTEFNALDAAFDESTGHTHDGTTGGGGVINTIADSDGKNKLVIDTSNNEIEFHLEISGTSTEQLKLTATTLEPGSTRDNLISLGTSSSEFKDLYIDGTANIDSLVADTADINGGTLYNVTFDGPWTAVGQTCANLGNVTTCNIDGGAIDGCVIGGNDPRAGYFTTLSTSSTLAVSGVTTLSEDLNVDSGVLFVDVSANRVGINDATPGYSLDVTGTCNVTGATTLGSTLGVTGVTTLSEDLNVDSGVLFVDVSADRVGINDASPSYSLDVNGTANVTGAVTLASTLAVTQGVTLSSTVGIGGAVTSTSANGFVVDSSGNAQLVVDKGATANANNIYGKVAGDSLWNVVLGDSGDDFRIYSYSGGSYSATPFTIERTTSDIYITADLCLDNEQSIRWNAAGGANTFIYGNQATPTILTYVGAGIVTRHLTGAFVPGSTDATNLGNSTYKWKEIFAVTATINTSDARKKTEIQPLSDAELNAAKELARSIGMYRFLSDPAKVWVGTTTQHVMQVLTDNGLDWRDYGFVHYDEAADDYGLRYTELNMFITRGLDARLQALESLMENL